MEQINLDHSVVILYTNRNVCVFTQSGDVDSMMSANLSFSNLTHSNNARKAAIKWLAEEPEIKFFFSRWGAKSMELSANEFCHLIFGMSFDQLKIEHKNWGE